MVLIKIIWGKADSWPYVCVWTSPESKKGILVAKENGLVLEPNQICLSPNCKGSCWLLGTGDMSVAA